MLKFDASSLPVCLVTVGGRGFNQTQLRDLAQFSVRNQMASVAGASVPQPFGGGYRQIMVYANPYKLEAHDLSLMDVVRTVNRSNLILPAGDVPIGALDYNIYTNSQLPSIEAIDRLPLKVVGQSIVRVADIGYAKDSQQIQTSIVRVDGKPSVYTPVLKQGGDTNTIAVVDGVRNVVRNLVDVPKDLVASVLFDQSRFVKTAIQTLIDEGGDRSFPDLSHDSDLSREYARYRGRVLFDSLIGAGDVHGALVRRRNGEQHGPGRACTRAIAADR